MVPGELCSCVYPNLGHDFLGSILNDDLSLPSCQPVRVPLLFFLDNLCAYPYSGKAGMIPDVGVGDTQKLQILESRLGSSFPSVPRVTSETTNKLTIDFVHTQIHFLLHVLSDVILSPPTQINLSSPHLPRKQPKWSKH